VLRTPRTWGVRAWSAACAVTIAFLLIVVPSSASAKTVRDYQWYLGPLKVERVHTLSRGAGVTVAVVDSGVDDSVPDLAGQVLPGAGFAEAAGTDGRRDFDAKAGHGTGMAGIIAGRGENPMRLLGMAPAAKILPVSTGVGTPNAALVSGIRWAADHGADVLNLSIGFAGPASPELVEAVRYALAKDVVVVASAGNTLENGRPVGQPASIPGVIAVAGADQQARAWAGSSTGPEVVVAAPAVQIISPRPRGVSSSGFGIADGTSGASAIVSGAAALVRSRFPDLDAANVINRLIVTARDQGLPGRDTAFGFGTVRPYEALTAQVPAVSRNPLLPPGDDGAPGPSVPVAAPGDAGGGGLGTAVVWVLGLVAALLVAGVVVVLLVLSRRRPPPAGPAHFAPAVVPPYPSGGTVGHGPPPPGVPAPPPAGAPPQGPRSWADRGV
jgi:type VII secretion-associated serine protease mycosin